jgi:hypothetical protein
MTMPSCPACQGSNTLPVAEHYETQVRLPEADPQLLAPLAPPLRRSIFSGTLCITLLWMAALSPGFVPATRGLMVALTFGCFGFVALLVWIRARKADRARMAAYLKARVCLSCGLRF